MLKFLIQTDKHKRVLHDFSFALLNAVHYHKWRADTNMLVWYWNKPLALMANYKHLADWIPIGSIHFTEWHLNHFHDFYPRPVNVPVDLYPFAGRAIDTGYKENIPLETDLYVKSHERIKWNIDFGGIRTNHDMMYLKSDHLYQYSTPIVINSEWRAFVYNGELLDIRNYSGSPFIFPNIDTVKQMIRAWVSAPKAYTLDVAINNNGTFVIECHDFFSCGLYGFENLNLLPFMFARWFASVPKRSINHYNRDI